MLTVESVFCKDKKKFFGPGKMACIKRSCVAVCKKVYIHITRVTNTNDCFNYM